MQVCILQIKIFYTIQAIYSIHQVLGFLALKMAVVDIGIITMDVLIILFLMIYQE